MKVTVLAPTGDSFKVLYQDDKTSEGFTLGVSGTLAAAWEMISKEEKLEALTKVSDEVLKSRSFKELHDLEVVFTTNDTQMNYELAFPAMVKNILMKSKRSSSQSQ